jgi:CheY-like chemotaxis protein
MEMHDVLVIDDEDSIRTAIRLALEDVGYDVLEAANGQDGLHMLRAATTPLIVILDLMMPRMTGVELLHAVTRDAGLASRDAFVICSVARAFPVEELAGYLPHGHLCILQKPFDVDTLIAAASSGLVRASPTERMRLVERRI